MLSIFDINYYSGESTNDWDFISITAVLVSLFGIYFSYKIIFTSKKIELRHKKFEDLCLNPLKAELKQVEDEMENSPNRLMSDFIPVFNTHQREFTILLTRIRQIYPDINASDIQDKYLDFIDYCSLLSDGTVVKSGLNRYRTLSFEILNDIYQFATDKSIYK